MTSSRRPVIWTVAGSDSGGGAGIQADLVTIHALGGHGCSVVTALTAQNTLGIYRVECSSPEMVAAQIAALQADLPPAAVKLGMLGHAGIIEKVAAGIEKAAAFVVCDPVMVSSSGTDLLAREAHDVLVRRILPLTDLLTPNVPEAEALLGRRLADSHAVELGAEDLLKLGVKSVLLKGGHAGGLLSQDFWTDGRSRFWLTSPRLETPHGHGSGCTLSSAIAVCMARGYSLPDALVIAKAYVNQGLRLSGDVGQGRSPVVRLGWPAHPHDLPWLTDSAAAAHQRPVFPDCGKRPLGLYPIVDRASWLDRLLPLGVTTIQLRCKDLSSQPLEDEVRRAVEISQRYGARLFINDRWDLALKHGAYGVHLGPTDIPGPADLEGLAKSSLRVGISAYSYADLARACSIRPSYVAVGAIYSTSSKDVPVPPLGVNELARMRGLVQEPVVAIGGITLEKAADLRAAGVNGMAVISDVVHAADPERRVRDWMAMLGP